MRNGLLPGRRVVVAVDGGGDTYMAADLVRRLIREGARVTVAATADTGRWVPDLTFATVSAGAVARTAAQGEALAEGADAVLLVACSTELLSSIVTRRAADAASAVYLCSEGPRVVVPGGCLPSAPWVRTHLKVLSEEATVLGGVEPAQTVIDGLARAVGPSDFSGRRVLVTAGPTREPIDPVRFISNPSTGRMGKALAETASRRGADVTLLMGPTSLDLPAKVRTLRFETAEDLWELASKESEDVDVVIAAAAVGDYAPVSPATSKVKKGDGEWKLLLERTPDVLARLGDRYSHAPTRPVLVGFAAETEEMVANARRKLEKKKLDFVVANDVSRADTGFASETNEVVLVFASHEEAVTKDSKDQVAQSILDGVVRLLRDRDGLVRERVRGEGGGLFPNAD